MDPLVALTKCGGAARWGRLRVMGVPERALRSATDRGVVLSIARGSYALPTAPPGLLAAVRLGGVASHVTAARLHGLGTWADLDDLHVTIPLGSSRAAGGVSVHRAALGAADVETWPAVTSVRRTVLDCARTLSLVDAVCVIDSALRAHLVRTVDLHAAAAVASGPGATALRRAVAHLDRKAGSPLESVLRLLLDLGAGEVRSQVWIAGVGVVDFLVDDWLVIEGDGFEFHADREAYRTDRRRANGLAARGYVLLRFTWEDVRFRPGWVAAEVERVRRRGPAAPPAEGC
jgi:very-short-patch-repair endonuclease